MHKKEYEDIIGLPHHVSIVHPQMSIYDRAAQFSPFAALTGHEAAIQETARLTEEQAELNEEHLAVTVTYFKPDNRKEGGKYETVTGTFRKIRDYDKMFILENGTGIACDMIYELEVNGFWK